MELPLNKYTQVKLPCQNSMDQKKEISHSYLESLKSNTIQYVSFFSLHLLLMATWNITSGKNRFLILRAIMTTEKIIFKKILEMKTINITILSRKM